MPSGPASRPPPHPAPKVSGVVVPHRAQWHQKLLAALICGLVRVVAVTVRFRLEDRPGFFNGAPRERIIFALWHNRLARSSVLWSRFVLRHAPERKIAGLVSASRDGGLLAAIFNYFGIEPVRGSSSRRGAQALRELVTRAEAGYDLAITPDGPRGPCYTVQEGVISVAQFSGLVIIPVSYHLSWKIQLRSWDRFQIPLPFTRCHVIIGQPLRVPREIAAEGREQLRQELERELRSITLDPAP